MGGSVWIGGESQTPGSKWEQQESTMFGRVGPATDEVQSIEEQDIWRYEQGLLLVVVSFDREVKSMSG